MLRKRLCFTRDPSRIAGFAVEPVIAAFVGEHEYGIHARFFKLQPFEDHDTFQLQFVNSIYLARTVLPLKGSSGWAKECSLPGQRVLPWWSAGCSEYNLYCTKYPGRRCLVVCGRKEALPRLKEDIQGLRKRSKRRCKWKGVARRFPGIALCGRSDADPAMHVNTGALGLAPAASTCLLLCNHGRGRALRPSAFPSSSPRVEATG